MIHKTALIDPGAELGTDVTIGPYCVIDADTRIGDGCRLGPHVTVHGNTTLGARCEVHAGAVLGDKPQDLGFVETVSYVRIGDDCVLRECVTVHRGTKEGTVTEIGDGCFLMGCSHFAHNVKLGRRVIAANGALVAGYGEIGDGVFISGNAMVHQFCKVGRLAMLGGGSASTKDVPPFCTVRTTGMNDVVGLNTVGLRRAGIGPAERRDIQRAFKILYKSGLNTGQAKERILAEFPSGPARELAEFVESSTRGICGCG